MNCYRQLYGNNNNCYQRQARVVQDCGNNDACSCEREACNLANNCATCNSNLNDSCNCDCDTKCGCDNNCDNNYDMNCGSNCGKTCGCDHMMHHHNSNCDGSHRDVYRNWDGCQDHFPIGMAYVPWQKFEDLYSVEEGFYTGTIFKQLDLEFYGRSCR